MTAVPPARRPVDTASTLLFVPGDRPERFGRAVACGADLVVLDLEDAVAPDHKDVARGHVSDALESGLRAAVRINAIGTPWHEADVVGASSAVAVMLPKAEAGEVLSALVARLSPVPVIALVETAQGVLTAADLARCGVARLAFGSFDLAAQLGVAPDDRDAMFPARGALVLASAAAGLPGPVDGVTGEVRDPTPVEQDAIYARRLGFTGKLCIHPAQVAPAAGALLPTEHEVAWATALVAAADAAAATGSAVLLHEGRMVDRPVLHRARRLLELASGRPGSET